MIRFIEMLRGVEMKADESILSKVGATRDELDVAIQEHLARV